MKEGFRATDGAVMLASLRKSHGGAGQRSHILCSVCKAPWSWAWQSVGKDELTLAWESKEGPVNFDVKLSVCLWDADFSLACRASG